MFDAGVESRLGEPAALVRSWVGGIDVAELEVHEAVHLVEECAGRAAAGGTAGRRCHHYQKTFLGYTYRGGPGTWEWIPPEHRDIDLTNLRRVITAVRRR